MSLSQVLKLVRAQIYAVTFPWWLFALIIYNYLSIRNLRILRYSTIDLNASFFIGSNLLNICQDITCFLLFEHVAVTIIISLAIA